MVENQLSRTERLIGKENLKKIKEMKVAVFGIGGVGSFVVEGLVRAGVGHIILVDRDTIDITNLNRQIHATQKTIGKSKVEAMQERIHEIAPDIIVKTYQEFYMPNTNMKILDKTIDYIADCMDTVTAKIHLIEEANKLHIPIISCMGTGNKLDPTQFEVADIYQTSVCPLAKVMRKELKQKGIRHLKVVYSKEKPIKQREERTPASISFVPSVAGMIIAGEIVKSKILKEGELK